MRTTIIAALALWLSACSCLVPEDDQPTTDDAAEGTGADAPDPEPAAKSSTGETGSAASSSCEEDLAKAMADLDACKAGAR